MGLCGSKPQPMPSHATTVKLKARRNPPSRDAKNAKQEFPQKGDKDKKKKKPQSITQDVQKKEGNKLSDTSDTSKDKISPQEAARLAAEKRFLQTNEKYNKSELGKKLAQERAKSHKTRLMEEAEKKHFEQERENMIYD
ncbi:hypothetical protein SKDZ_07G1500 [Saccharomyces kudriavzevii ZP591]|uniref:YGL108C-like protein n=1 Tax=Saccharomyces cerevisiae x Saccharomyces kudriavzevii (strain VIN7) TaxID=1095631 RepID=H0GUQ7_SACCK|nr:YGL108C-like protein [Saccharomyces cerevisiae x Saccharomyces kudriavzevii VIN7]CAI4061744.1 hypothetical protein SKDZ_07G1500 [Saccharomyces kudriavzevii ZP591]CAI5269685.1 AIS_HP2_G0018090.mRNA.1.CDS.1 [Saccharomyces cerevisiae]CAI6505326.1 AIS_HP2_G0018090.mRNA.1.CDS.1 [Saccharomyces cerevisiae]